MSQSKSTIGDSLVAAVASARSAGNVARQERKSSSVLNFDFYLSLLCPPLVDKRGVGWPLVDNPKSLHMEGRGVVNAESHENVVDSGRQRPTPRVLSV